MRTLTKNQIRYEPYCLFYILPYKRDEDDKECLKKTRNFLYKSSELLNRVSVIIGENNNIIFSAEYEGYSGYYEYELDFELVNYKEDDEDSGDEKLMLLGSINQSEHELFEEIIKEKILPKWSEYLGLKSYYSFK